MYIIKNALRSISRSKGRNILIGIIALVIAVSACIALSIKESAIKAKEDTLSSMKITGQISLDRQKMMENSKQDGEFNRDSMKEMLQNNGSLTLDEYQKYSKSTSVKSFYYNITSSLNANDDIEPVDSNGSFSKDDSSSTTNNDKNMGGGMGFSGKGGFGGGMMGSQGDFTIVGYSDDAAMTSFVDGTSKITSGNVFSEGTSDNDIIITEELATYNNLSVGNAITLVNPNNEEESFTFNVVGIYQNTSTDDDASQGMFNTAGDSANKIYMSYTALKTLIDASNENATETTDETTGRTTSTAISSSINATYTFDGIDEYEKFSTEVYDMGLDDTYSVSSTDVSQFENSLVPLENLSKMADYFLIVVFAIGAIILVVLNIFNIRERKYEIGVLTAIGMKKAKVAMQFITEIFVITISAIIIGAGIGAVTSVPVTNALLSNQISSNQQASEERDQSFGREMNGNNGGNMQPSTGNNINKTQGKGFMNNFMGGTTNYISEVSYSTDLSVILKLILVGIGLTIVSSLVAVSFIMRYEPLKILTSRD